MEAAARRACEDARAGRALLDAVDTVAVVTNVFHDYGDTARMLASRLGVRPARTILTTWGGNTPQSLLSHLCDEIAADRIGVALLAGGEAFQTMGRSARPAEPVDPPSAVAVPRWGDTAGRDRNRIAPRRAYVSFALFENVSACSPRSAPSWARSARLRASPPGIRTPVPRREGRGDFFTTVTLSN